MMRLVFLAVILTILFAGVLAVINVLAAMGGRATDTREVDTMPRTFSRIAYVVLILLMLGVTSGLLGAA